MGRKSKYTIEEKIQAVIDYKNGVKNELETLPKSNVIKYILDDGSWIVVRPSGTEPKIKIYYCIKAKNEAEAQNKFALYGTIIKEKLEL